MLSRTLSVVRAIDAAVSAPTPSKNADAGVCWPNGPRSRVILCEATKLPHGHGGQNCFLRLAER